ncbi:hypothetical protein QTP70_028757, partial [Hemibagrus guttatus]
MRKRQESELEVTELKMLRVGDSIPASAVCVEFARSPRALGVSSGYSGFLHQSKDMRGRLIGISKLSVVYDC